MIISDLSYLEVVSEASSIVGGEEKVAVAAKSDIAATGTGNVTATANTSATITDVEGKPIINLDNLLNQVDKMVKEEIKEATK